MEPVQDPPLEEVGFDYLFGYLFNDLQEETDFDYLFEYLFDNLQDQELGVVGGQQGPPRRIRKEQPQVKVPVVLTPTDVICERGALNTSQGGNISFRGRAHQKLTELRSNGIVYKDLNRQDKMAHSLDLVNWVHEQGGRFVARDKYATGMYGPWYVVLPTTARQKASQYMRDEYNRMLRRENLDQN